MPRQPLSSPTPRAVAVVVREHKLLVIDRHLDGRDYAVLPGGGIEPGETAAEAAVRELREECSLDGVVTRHLFDGTHGGREASYFLVEAPGEPALGAGESSDEANSHLPLWATAGELPLFPLLPEGLGEQLVEAIWPLTVEPVSDWAVVERLWQLYSHDLSEFRHTSPGPDGRFREGRLPDYRDGSGRASYVAELGGAPVGFALVHWPTEVGSEDVSSPDEGARRMGEFFVARSARGRGVARAFASAVIARHPGPWEIPFQDENPRAAAFWRRLAADVLSGVEEQRIPVPGKRHLPPDVWLTGSTR